LKKTGKKASPNKMESNILSQLLPVNEITPARTRASRPGGNRGKGERSGFRHFSLYREEDLCENTYNL
jgi:hypothetical protein